MSTTPSMNLVLPDDHDPTEAELWGSILITALGPTGVDGHDHTTGKGVQVPMGGIKVDADKSWSFGGTSRAITDLKAIDFAPTAAAGVVALAGAFFLSDGTGGLVANELYYRTTTGSNVRMTNGAALNVGAFAGGIVGDYSAVGAAVAYDDSLDRYTFKQEGGVGAPWARLASGDVRLFETGTTEALFVGLAAPTALAGSYTITWPTAPPASTQVVTMDASGVVATTADPKHGDRLLTLAGTVFVASAGTVGYANTGQASPAGAATLVAQVPLLVGDRIKSVTGRFSGDGAVDITEFNVLSVLVGVPTSLGSTTLNNVPGGETPLTINVADTTVVSNQIILIRVVVNAGGFVLNSIEVTLDRP